jgi:hypothetical protein
MLDRAKLHKQLPYQDKELQTIIRDIDLFSEFNEESVNSTSSASSTNNVPNKDAKSSLFQSKKKDVQPSGDVKKKEEVEEVSVDLDNIHIDDDDLHHDITNITSSNVGAGNINDDFIPASNNNTSASVVVEEEDDDEVDLS